MDVSQRFNSQYVMISFDMLDCPQFMRFVGSTTFSVYLILRRYIWRSEQRQHRAGLHDLYAQGYLTASISVPALAEKTGVTDRSIREATARLEQMGIVQSRMTGRENIYVLGEWVDISQEKDGHARKEWFYAERVFATRRMDLPVADVPAEGRAEENFLPDVQVRGRQENVRLPDRQVASATNKEENRESVNALQTQTKDPEHVRYLVDEILAVCGDEKSRAYYTKLANRLPDDLIFRSLAEIRQDSAIRNKGAVLVSKLRSAYASQD